MVDGLEVSFALEDQANKFRACVELYEDRRKECDSAGLSKARLNRLQTAAKKLIVMALSDIELEVVWHAKDAILIIDGNKLDFS